MSSPYVFPGNQLREQLASHVSGLPAPGPGLTKRELFAAIAMQGLLGDGDEGVPSEVYAAQQAEGSTTESVMAAWHRFVARTAVGYADALLAALAEEENDGR